MQLCWKLVLLITLALLSAVTAIEIGNEQLIAFSYSFNKTSAYLALLFPLRKSIWNICFQVQKV